jgi:hypothetical protein
MYSITENQPQGNIQTYQLFKPFQARCYIATGGVPTGGTEAMGATVGDTAGGTSAEGSADTGAVAATSGIGSGIVGVTSSIAEGTGSVNGSIGADTGGIPPTAISVTPTGIAASAGF